jgi:molybdate transport system regulatory protein
MVQVRFRVDLAPGCSVGPGKVELLAAIEAEGSLSAAARLIGMSYRRAWLLLDALNGTFDTPVTTANVGGRGGGGVALTPFGRHLVRTYRAFEKEVGALASRRWLRLARYARADRGSLGPVRAARQSIRRRPAASKRP